MLGMKLRFIRLFIKNVSTSLFYPLFLIDKNKNFLSYLNRLLFKGRSLQEYEDYKLSKVATITIAIFFTLFLLQLVYLNYLFQNASGVTMLYSSNFFYLFLIIIGLFTVQIQIFMPAIYYFVYWSCKLLNFINSKFKF